MPNTYCKFFGCDGPPIGISMTTQGGQRGTWILRRCQECDTVFIKMDSNEMIGPGKKMVALGSKAYFIERCKTGCASKELYIYSVGEIGTPTMFTVGCNFCGILTQRHEILDAIDAWDFMNQKNNTPT
jgi:hypothetical protein